MANIPEAQRLAQILITVHQLDESINYMAFGRSVERIVDHLEGKIAHSLRKAAAELMERCEVPPPDGSGSIEDNVKRHCFGDVTVKVNEIFSLLNTVVSMKL